MLLLALLVTAGWLLVYAYQPGPKAATDSVVVTIPRGASVRRIGEILGRNRLISDDIRFLVLAKLTGKAGRMKAGEFRFATGKTPLAVIDMLVTAKPVEHAVTVPEGLTAREMAAIFSRDHWCDAGRYLALVHSKQFIDRLGLTGLPSLEGYLYPDTYYLTRDIHGAATIITIQVHRFLQVWSRLTKAAAGVADRQKVVILASMVEKETADPSERPLIAAVFLNRLKRGMRLQSDPTVVYGMEDFDGRITKEELATPTPYNTYIVPGLPAGPIANPGRASLLAVLHPASTRDLYFVAKNDGTHQFSTNLKDHNRAVLKFQRRKVSKSGKE